MNDFFTTSSVDTAAGLFIGATVLLSVGALVVYLSKRPAFRQRVAEITVFVCAAWVLLAIIPLPRIGIVPQKTGESSLALVDTHAASSIDDVLLTSGSSQGFQAPTQLSSAQLSSAQQINVSQLPDTLAAKYTWPETVWFGYILISGCLLAWIACTRFAMVVFCMRSQPTPMWIDELYGTITKRRQARVVISSRNIRPMAFGTSVAVVVLSLAVGGFGVQSGVGQEVDSTPAKQTNPQAKPQTTATEVPPTRDERDATKPAKTPKATEHIQFSRAYAGLVNDLLMNAAEDGRVIKIHVQPGQTVKQGEVLMQIVSPELEQAVAERSLSVMILKQTIDGNVNVRDAMMSLDSYQEENQALIALQRQKAVTPLEVVKSKKMVERAKLRVELSQAEARKSRLELQRDQSVLLQLQDRISELQVRAPFDGRVEAVSANAGQSVARGEQLCRLVALDKIRMEFDVPIDTIFPPRLLRQDVTVEIRSAAKKPISLKGKIAFVSSDIDLSNRCRVWAVCDNVQQNGHWMVRPGMMGDVSVDVPAEG